MASDISEDGNGALWEHVETREKGGFPRLVKPRDVNADEVYQNTEGVLYKYTETRGVGGFYARVTPNDLID